MSVRVLTVITLLSLTPVHAAGAQQDPAAALRAAEEQLAQALIAADEAAFDRLLAPDFLLRGSPDVARATWIQNALTLCWGSQATISEFRIAGREGDTVIVALVLTTDRDPTTCDSATVRSLLTDVWRQDEAGAWRLVLRHSGAAGGITTQFTRQAPPPPVAEGSAELSLVNTGGNTDTQTLGVAGAVIWRPGPWTTDARVSFVRTATESVETARSFLATVRQSRVIHDRLDAFGRFEFRMNEFSGIDGRVSFDAGLGYRLLEGDPHRLRLDAGVGYSREDRVATPTISSANANLGVAYRWRLSGASSVTDTMLVTAALDDGDDWRAGNTLALTTNVNRVFSVKLAHELKFVNQPVLGFEKTDTILSAALVARF